MGMTTYALTEPIEAIGISDSGKALVAMVDFPTGQRVTVERQADAGDTGIFGWEGATISYYRTRGWNAGTETIFRVGTDRYVTLNLPRHA